MTNTLKMLRSATPSYTVDHQKLKDRLGTIVRAKEGYVPATERLGVMFLTRDPLRFPVAFRRMVNVNTPLPLNLHNKDVLGRRLDPSSSRSARSRSAHATMGGPTGNGPEMLPEVPSRVASYSPTRDRDLPPPLEASRSTTSLRPGDASYLPEGDENESRRPLLNVKLVRGAGGFSIGGETPSKPRQGRSTARGRPGYAEAVGAPVDAEGENGPAMARDLKEDDAPSGGREGLHMPLGSGSSPQAVDFKIQSVGNITCSWGD